VRDHAIIVLIAAVTTALLVPAVRPLAFRMRAVGYRAGERGIAAPVPTLGGLAMFGGTVVALLAALVLPLESFGPVFEATSEPVAVILGVALIAALGMLDDLFDLSAALKLAGQLAVATLVVSLGVQLQYFWLPGIGVIALSADLGLVLTVLFLVGFVNLVNLADGLDGLAAGVVAIGALAFLLYVAAGGGVAGGRVSSASLLAAITAGVAAGFLVHNWYPASIFMGDTGSMQLGLLLGSAAVAHVGRSSAPTAAEFTASVPLAVPLVVLAVPFVDTVLTIVRRVRSDQPVTMADLGHLHHRLAVPGESHRRAVLLLCTWSALAGTAVVGPLYLPGATVAGLLVIVVLAVSGFTLLELRRNEQHADALIALDASDASDASATPDAPGAHD